MRDYKIKNYHKGSEYKYFFIGFVYILDLNKKINLDLLTFIDLKY